MNEQKPKARRGCLFYGGITAGVLFLVILLAIFSAVRLAKSYINEYTGTTPLSLPTVQVSDEEVARIRDRIKTFRDGLHESKPVEPLILTADEVNALIAKDPDLKGLQGHFYVTLEEGQIKAQLSIPTDNLGIRFLRGRYLNGIGTFKASLRGGELWVTAESLTSAKGNAFPEDFMRSFRTVNFASGYTNNPDFNATIARFEDIQVKPDKLIVIPKKPQ